MYMYVYIYIYIYIDNLILISFIPHHTNILYDTDISSIQKALGLLNWEKPFRNKKKDFKNVLKN